MKDVLNNLLRKVPQDGEYHTIQLEVKWEGYSVITRNAQIIGDKP